MSAKIINCVIIFTPDQQGLMKFFEALLERQSS